MSKRLLIFIAIFAIASTALFSIVNSQNETAKPKPVSSIALPAPILKGTMSLEEALAARKSNRGFKKESLTMAEISQLLWAGQGITHAQNHRTAPSAMVTYPIELYLLAENVDSLTAGLYKYDPISHSIIKQQDTVVFTTLMKDAIGQDWIATSPAIIIIAGNYGGVRTKLGESASKYVNFEAGCVAQNIGLEVAALYLGSTVVGGIDSAKLKILLMMPADEDPIVIMPVGKF
jgi:SagB-type dehydrogenase family enzyme